MIALWMAYALVLSTLLGVAAVGLERALRLYRRPSRWVWALVIAASVTVPVVLRFVPGRARATPTAVVRYDAASFHPSALVALGDALATRGESLRRLDAPLSILWGTLTLTLALVVAGGSARLGRRRRDWPARPVEGHRVRVSEDFGPAVVGLRSPEIVLPRWTLGLSPGELRMVLAHEGEHRAARDTQLLAMGLLAVVAMPWNVPLWWHLRRLRRAVEVDCDRRVLHQGVPALEYGSLLLRVGAHLGGPIPFAVTLTEPKSLLERRIRMIAEREPKGRVRKAMAGLGLAAVVLAVACETPAPTVVEGDAEAAEVERGGLVMGAAPSDRADRPLIIVDGVITDDRLADIDAYDVESIEVVKGAAAKALYGERAANGVIHITTKTKAGADEVARFGPIALLGEDAAARSEMEELARRTMAGDAEAMRRYATLVAIFYAAREGALRKQVEADGFEGEALRTEIVRRLKATEGAVSTLRAGEKRKN